jgi:antitoxin component of RelBE/YafQ-DinJ toxin-antitoxin module
MNIDNTRASNDVKSRSDRVTNRVGLDFSCVAYSFA